MKKFITCMTIISIIVSVGILAAQEEAKPFASAFCSAATDSVQFDVDIVDSIGMDSSVTHQLIYRDPTVNSWNESMMSELYHVCSLYTFSTTIEFNTSSWQLEWYNRSEGDSAVATQSPKNSGDVFPVPLYLEADLGADSVGDAENAAGPFLDIVHGYASYSDTKLYSRLVNNGGGFPTNSGFTTYFTYSVGIVDPDASDSIAYAMIYANIPMLLSPGLYAFDPTDSSFTKIGDISTHISGNSLSMSCNISDLTSQPSWSDWPPPSGFIILAPLTGTQDLSGLASNDFGKIALYLPESHTTDFEFNETPNLSSDTVQEPAINTVSASVEYSDPDAHLPAIRMFHFGTEVYSMTACEKDYIAGTLFETDVTFDSTGWYQYYFEFSDGAETVTTTLDSIYVEFSEYIPGDADGSGTVDIDDVVYLVNYIFSSGPPPYPLEAGDADCSGTVDIDDVVYLISYIFSGGPAPCE